LFFPQIKKEKKEKMGYFLSAPGERSNARGGKKNTLFPEQHAQPRNISNNRNSSVVTIPEKK